MTHNGVSTRVSRLALFAVFSVVVALAAFAVTPVSAQTAQTEQTVKSKDKKSKSTQTEVSVQSSEQRAVIDPQTGKLKEPSADDSRDSRDLMEQMSKKHQRNPENLNVIQQADGTLMVQLGEEYMDVMVVKIGPDGKPVMECVRGVSNAEAAVTAEAKAASDTANPVAKSAEAGLVDASLKAKSASQATDSKKSDPAAKKPAPATGRKE